MVKCSKLSSFFFLILLIKSAFSCGTYQQVSEYHCPYVNDIKIKYYDQSKVHFWFFSEPNYNLVTEKWRSHFMYKDPYISVLYFNKVTAGDKMGKSVVTCSYKIDNNEEITLISENPIFTKIDSGNWEKKNGKWFCHDSTPSGCTFKVCRTT